MTEGQIKIAQDLSALLTESEAATIDLIEPMVFVLSQVMAQTEDSKADRGPFFSAVAELLQCAYEFSCSKCAERASINVH